MDQSRDLFQCLAKTRAGAEDFVRAIAGELDILGGTKTIFDENHNRWITSVVRDLQNHRGASIVLAGDQQPPIVHAFVHAINHVLGNANQTVIYTEPVAAHSVNQLESLRELVQDMNDGAVETLVMGPRISPGSPVNFPISISLSFNGSTPMARATAWPLGNRIRHCLSARLINIPRIDAAGIHLRYAPGQGVLSNSFS